MSTYRFDLILDRPSSDEDDERLFELFRGRASSAVVNGVPTLYMHVAAESMDHAIREAIRGVGDLGFSVERIEVDPAAFTDAA